MVCTLCCAWGLKACESVIFSSFCFFIKSIDLCRRVLWRCVWRRWSPLAVTATCFGTFVGTMRRPHDLPALKCWWWVWRLYHYGVDAVLTEARPTLILAVAGLFPSFPGRWLISETQNLKTPLWSENFLKSNSSPEASRRLAARHMFTFTLQTS
jgi:hypothetical protein